MQDLVKSSPRAHASSSSASTMFNGLNVAELSEGLTIAEVRDSNLLLPARWTLERSLSRGSDHLGVPLSGPAQVASLHCGPTRAFRSVMLMFAALGDPNIRVDHVSEASSIAWHTPEGLAVLRRKLGEAAPGWLSFVIRVTAESDDLRFGLQEIRAMSKQIRCNVLAVLDSADAPRTLGLYEFADEYVEVHSCDPNPGATCSFSLLWKGLEVLAPFGVIPTMFSVHVQDGSYRIRCSPYLHESLEYRQTWVLRALGLSASRISEILEVNKTTIHRRLTEMPSPNSGPTFARQRLVKLALQLGLSGSALESALGNRPSETERRMEA